MNAGVMHPRGAWLTVNQQCSFRCRWCYAEETGYRRDDEMTLDFAVKMTSIIKDIGIKHLIVIGGEPTLWKPLMNFCRFCEKESLGVAVVTNLAELNNDDFWSKFSQFGNVTIAGSLKASTPAQLVEVAKYRNFNKMRGGLVRAASHPRSSLSITYNTFYEDSLVELVGFAVKCGFKSIKIDFCSTTFKAGRPDGEFMVEPRRLVANIVRDYSVLNEITGGRISFEINLPFCLWPVDFLNTLRERNQIASVCHLIKREGVIFGTKGEVMMCNALFDYPIGFYGQDFSNSGSLLRLLNSSKVSGYYDRMSSLPLSKCAECELYGECGGGCPLRWTMYNPKKLLEGR